MSDLSLEEAILYGNARALGRYTDALRARGANYYDVYERVCDMFVRAGREPPDLNMFDDKLGEAYDRGRGRDPGHDSTCCPCPFGGHDDAFARDPRRAAPAMSDPELTARARELLKKYLPEIAPPASIQWSMRMQCSKRRAKWGVCVPSQRAIRISAELKKVPAWVRDSVIIHELAHLKVPNHGPEFQALVNRYPRTAEERAFLKQYMKSIESDAREAGVARRGTKNQTGGARRKAATGQQPRVNVSVGDHVSFGRPQGQKTRGVVLRVAGKTALVQTRESRGRGRASGEGTKWRVPLDARFLTVQRRGRGHAKAQRVPARPPARPPARRRSRGAHRPDGDDSEYG